MIKPLWIKNGLRITTDNISSLLAANNNPPVVKIQAPLLFRLKTAKSETWESKKQRLLEAFSSLGYTFVSLEFKEGLATNYHAVFCFVKIMHEQEMRKRIDDCLAAKITEETNYIAARIIAIAFYSIESNWIKVYRRHDESKEMFLSALRLLKRMGYRVKSCPFLFKDFAFQISLR